MLDNATKRKIDSARNILVGKVPDPKAQVEQITTALVYKFMDDMDTENEEAGLSAQFFIDDYAKYSWRKIMDNRLSGQERMDLYVEAVANIPKSKNIPQLFRDIFKGAFLPFRDPRTLSLFLKEINEFNYDNSENLGNAFEYLLSILGSQGDAGQFRTPRHIIDFIVEVVNPKKNETVLDPACGTAGFLISAYKHILKTNSSNFKPEEEKVEDKIAQGETATETIIADKINYSGDLLSPDDKTKLTHNIAGYDISPDMVKLALVNLYLHGFSDPKIFEYDTLSSDKRWDETFDVILANPPFMTPKGGIVPHKKFSIQANRAEVLFVDYIAEHLSIKGRAGIIVPEGIIFQSANAYKNLRKNLIENWGLYAVVSLPSGVFQPYSGVKTSILLMDREFAKKTDEILFLKVEHDGFDLGAQRRKIEKNDLPECLQILESWKKNVGAKNFLQEWNKNFCSVPKQKIAENGDYNLTGERYKIDLPESLKANFETITKALEPHQKIFKDIVERHQKQAEQIQKSIQPVIDQFQKQQESINEAFASLQEPIKQMQKAFEGYDFSKLQELAELAKEELSKNQWPMVELGEILDYEQPTNYIVETENYNDKYKTPVLTAGKSFLLGYTNEENDIFPTENLPVIIFDDFTTATKFVNFPFKVKSSAMKILKAKENASISYVFYMMQKLNFDASQHKRYWISQYSKIKIPLPPLEVQEQIVAKIEQYQKVIDGAKQVVENWKPSFRINPSWEMVELGEVCEFTQGIQIPQSEQIREYKEGYKRYIYISDLLHDEKLIFVKDKYSNKEVSEDDLIMVNTGNTSGKVFWGKTGVLSNNVFKISYKANLDSKYLYFNLSSDFFYKKLSTYFKQGAQPHLGHKIIAEQKIPLPPLEIQKQIVAEIEAEQKVVIANKGLIEKMEKKIEAKIGEVWGEEI